jgi:hypothetical protein
MAVYQSRKSIEDFKSNLANGGVRPTMFEVQIAFPDIVRGSIGDLAGATTNADEINVSSDPGNPRPSGPELTEKSTFMVKAATMPGSNIGMIPVPFRGRRLKVAGDRTFNDWQTTIYNDSDYRLRDAIEKWSEIIQYHNFAIGHNQLTDGVTEPLAGETQGYMGSGFVRQLDRQGRQLKIYKLSGIWPITIDEINLDFGTNDTIEEYGVTWAVQYWHAAGRQSENGPSNTGFKIPANTQREVIS